VERLREAEATTWRKVRLRAYALQGAKTWCEMKGVDERGDILACRETERTSDRVCVCVCVREREREREREMFLTKLGEGRKRY